MEEAVLESWEKIEVIIDMISHSEICTGNLQGKKYDVKDKRLEVRWG